MSLLPLKRLLASYSLINDSKISNKKHSSGAKQIHADWIITQFNRTMLFEVLLF